MATAHKSNISTKKAKKKPSTAIVAWDEKLAARAAMTKKQEASVATGSFISTKGGILSYMGNAVPENKLNLVIIDAIMENHIYDGKYDPNTPASPVCYAFGRDEDEMVPHEKIEEPFADACAGCLNNEWGSADTGKGKACKNIRRLAVITEDALDGGAETIEEADVAYIKIPVTSVKAWAGYVNQLATTNKPPLAFVTEVSVVPDAASQFKVQFKALEEIDDGELIEALLAKADIVEQQIAFPYQAVEVPVAPAPRAQARATTRKAAAKAPRSAPAKQAAKVTKATPGRRKF